MRQTSLSTHTTHLAMQNEPQQNPIPLAIDQPKTLKKLAAPTIDHQPLCIEDVPLEVGFELISA